MRHSVKRLRDTLGIGLGFLAGAYPYLWLIAADEVLRRKGMVLANGQWDRTGLPEPVIVAIGASVVLPTVAIMLGGCVGCVHYMSRREGWEWTAALPYAIAGILGLLGVLLIAVAAPSRWGP